MNNMRKDMNSETKIRRIYPFIISPAAVIPAVLGVQHWQENSVHSLGFLLARFFIVWVLAAAIGGVVGITVLRLMFKK
jgi:uncharacterized membrane protein